MKKASSVVIVLFQLRYGAFGFTTPRSEILVNSRPQRPSTRIFGAISPDEQRSTSNSDGGGNIFRYSSTSLKHLESTELDDDYSRPWTEVKTRAILSALAVATSLGILGEFLATQLDIDDKLFVIFAAFGAAGGWFLGGGKQVAEDEKPINGGYDRKLIADRPGRMAAILDHLSQNGLGVKGDEPPSKESATILKYINMVHDADYVRHLETVCMETDRPKRLNPVYSRTLVDQHSFQASLNAVADWMASVDGALQNKPRFALVRPPSHHACKAKGMGGCLLNSVAIAARYALDQDGVNSVAILDVDAHHGNGIAHCIQDIPEIRYCSIHEELADFAVQRAADDPNDPRSSSDADSGPLGNILNINVPSGTTWKNGYQTALVESALPFLLEKKPDIVLVAAGFDALEADLTSKIRLQPRDFDSVGHILHEKFGSRVAFGLEGGYCWKDGELQQAITHFVSAWR